MTTLEKKKKSKDGVAILVIALLSVAAAVMTALFVTARAKQAKADERYRVLAESTYRKSYYALVYNVDGLDTAADKLTVASGKAFSIEERIASSLTETG